MVTTRLPAGSRAVLPSTPLQAGTARTATTKAAPTAAPFNPADITPAARAVQTLMAAQAARLEAQQARPGGEDETQPREAGGKNQQVESNLEDPEVNKGVDPTGGGDNDPFADLGLQDANGQNDVGGTGLDDAFGGANDFNDSGLDGSFAGAQDFNDFGCDFGGDMGGDFA